MPLLKRVETIRSWQKTTKIVFCHLFLFPRLVRINFALCYRISMIRIERSIHEARENLKVVWLCVEGVGREEKRGEERRGERGGRWGGWVLVQVGLGWVGYPVTFDAVVSRTDWDSGTRPTLITDDLRCPSSSACLLPMSIDDETSK